MICSTLARVCVEANGEDNHSGLVLISKPLNRDNYSTWERAIYMWLALNFKNKMGFVNGSVKAPSQEADPEGYAALGCYAMIWSTPRSPTLIVQKIADSVVHKKFEKIFPSNSLKSNA